MTFILVGASLILALMALAHVKSVEFSDPTITIRALKRSQAD
jgi:hypothetical protein